MMVPGCLGPLQDPNARWALLLAHSFELGSELEGMETFAVGWRAFSLMGISRARRQYYQRGVLKELSGLECGLVTFYQFWK